MSDGFVLSKRQQDSPKASRAAAAAAASNNSTTNNRSKNGDPNADECYVMHKWRQEQLWIERINAEHKGKVDWETYWDFLAGYDQKGNVKDKKVLPERVNMFTELLPNSNGHEYGFRLNTDIGLHMQDMQNKFNEQHKLKMSKDLTFND